TRSRRSTSATSTYGSRTARRPSHCSRPHFRTSPRISSSTSRTGSTTRRRGPADVEHPRKGGSARRPRGGILLERGEERLGEAAPDLCGELDGLVDPQPPEGPQPQGQRATRVERHREVGAAL